MDTHRKQDLDAQMKTTNYRCGSDSWSEDESDSSSSSDISSDSDFFKMIIQSSVPKKLPEVKTKGEIGLDELPPIDHLTITVYEEEMMLIGKIHAVVDKLVVVHALKDLKALDLDSVLFLSYNKPLGRVFDVFGPVVQPFYCVRFNSVDHINEKGIEVGGDVFFAPEKRDITSYVFVDELQKQKGSDASWKYNNEPPEEAIYCKGRINFFNVNDDKLASHILMRVIIESSRCLDFSDDEKEKAAKRKRMNKNRNRQISATNVATKSEHLTGSPYPNYSSYSGTGVETYNTTTPGYAAVSSVTYAQPYPSNFDTPVSGYSYSPVLSNNYAQTNFSTNPQTLVPGGRNTSYTVETGRSSGSPYPNYTSYSGTGVEAYNTTTPGYAAVSSVTYAQPYPSNFGTPVSGYSYSPVPSNNYAQPTFSTNPQTLVPGGLNTSYTVETGRSSAIDTNYAKYSSQGALPSSNYQRFRR